MVSTAAANGARHLGGRPGQSLQCRVRNPTQAAAVPACPVAGVRLVVRRQPAARVHPRRTDLRARHGQVGGPPLVRGDGPGANVIVHHQRGSSFKTFIYISGWSGNRVARFFLVLNTKAGKIYQINMNYTKCP
jgi:hypothetical protein